MERKATVHTMLTRVIVSGVALLIVFKRLFVKDLEEYRQLADPNSWRVDSGNKVR